MATLSEIKRKNKAVGQHFFDRGNPRVLAKAGNYLVTTGMGGGYIVYKFDSSNGHINLVNNSSGSYSWEPYATKKEALLVAHKLAKGKH